MTIRRCLLVLMMTGVAFLLLPARLTHAGDDWLPIDPADLKMTSDPLAPGAAAVYLYRQVDRDDSGNARTEFNYVRIKILTEEGRRAFGNVEVPFIKELVTVSNIKARTIRPDGSIANFDGKVYENAIVKGPDRKYLAKTFALPEVSVGSIVEYRYNYDFSNKYILSSDWILSAELFTRRAKFSLIPYTRPGTLVWKYPAGLPQGTQPPIEGPDHIFRMRAKNIPAFPIEEHMPPEYELKYSVVFFRTRELLETEPDKYWKKYEKKEYGEAASFVDRPKAMEEALAQIVAPGDTPEEKLHKVYDRVQQVRNLNYETRKTEQEEKREKLKPASNVEVVWKDGKGTGDEINLLFMALTRAAGFEVYAGLVSPRDQYFFQRERMNAWELDASVVLVKLNGKFLYFDPGAAFMPYGLLPWRDTGVTCLRLGKDEGEWMESPLPDSSASRVDRTADLKLSEDGTLQGKLKVTYRGLEALSRRVEEQHQDDTARKKYLEDEVKESVPSGSEVELTNKPKWEGSDYSLVAEFGLKVPGWAPTTGHRKVFPIGLFGNPEKHLFEHGERVQPIYFHYAFKKIDILSVELPKGWKVVDLPKPIQEDAKSLEYRLRVDDLAGNLNVRRELRSELMLVQAERYPALRSFYQTVRMHDQEQILLEPGANSAKN